MIPMDNNVGRFLSEAFAAGRASHAYIVAGERRYVRSLLRECALVTMCHNHVGDDCDACKKVLAGENMDVISLPLDEQKNRLAVSDIAYLVEESYRRPIDNSEQRVFLLDATDSVSGIGCEMWQNKLLKTLEEPIDGVYIFVGVTDAESLLPTVRSRCQIIKQTVLSANDVKQALLRTSFDLTSCEMAAAMAGGSIQRGESILANPAVFEAYRTAVGIATEMESTKVALKFAAAILAKRDYVNDCLGFLTLLYRESVAYRVAADLCLLPHLRNTIDKICANYTLQAAEVCIEKINAAKRRLDDGGNVTVVIDGLLTSILEIKYICRR